MSRSVERLPFGTTSSGEPIERWRLDNGRGVTADVLSYGAILHAFAVPDSSGQPGSIVLAPPDAESYLGATAYYGAVAGRFANRIADGRFTLDGQEYTLPVNDRGHTLHGGTDGFDSRIWRVEPVADQPDRAAVRLSLTSPDGDMGFPGTLTVSVTYTLDADGTLALDYHAVTDRPTVLNLTNHAYFNLAGSENVLDHVLTVDADHYLPADATAIPHGPAKPVAGTPFDFTSAHPLGARIGEPDEQLLDAGGYDHCWVLRPHEGLARAAVLTDPASGRRLEVWTTEPGVQVYTSNKLDGTLADAGGRRHLRHSAVCLETQHLPNSPNVPDYPTTVLLPGETFTSRTELRTA
ncbi:aldose epimerase family protein [Rugosimonospora africana]|uniref:Aldose 1-epimerase n=1 Tax=Rugosimonospora africana TaxID=556532 RepID=A0A8J3QZP1_9ACTN|nr:aldose epimerase family protein [Rugosimonospora africana]GIH18833.1 aldose 1-epimerase [Rugosimonospora africana]